MRKLLPILILCLAARCFAGTTVLNQFTFPAQSTTGATDSIDFPRDVLADHTASLVVTGSPTGCTYRLEGSVNGTTWADISGAQTCTASTIFTVTGHPVTHIRGYLISLSGGNAPTVTLSYAGTPATGAGGSGVSITTVSGLASVAGKTAGTIAVATNGNSPTDCSAGGGTTIVTCQYDGAVWAAFGGSNYTLPTATNSVLGGVKPDGTTIANSSGAISVSYGTSSTTAAAGNDSRFTAPTVTTIATTTNCAAAGSGANPSLVACAAAASGSFSCATNASTGTCSIATTAVTANSRIFVQPSVSEGANLSVTCNTASDTGLTAPRLLSKTAATGFIINLGTFTTNPVCFDYWVVN